MNFIFYIGSLLGNIIIDSLVLGYFKGLRLPFNEFVLNLSYTESLQAVIILYTLCYSLRIADRMIYENNIKLETDILFIALLIKLLGYGLAICIEITLK